MRKGLVLLSLAIFLALVTNVNADLVAIWDFGPDAANYTLVPQYEYAVGIPIMSAGGATYDIDGGNGVQFTDAAGNVHSKGQALHWNDVSGQTDDAYIIIGINTTGWKNMAIRWDYFSDNTGTKKGPVSFDLDYMVGAGSWTNLLNNFAITRDDAWHEFSYDLSLLTAINNQSSVQFRINDFNHNDLDGDYWQDNVQLTAAQVPEPCSVILFAFGGAALLIKRRK